MYMKMYIEDCTMGDRHSIAEARSNLPKLVREAEHGKAVELTRRGEPVAILIGRRQFEWLTSGHRGFFEAYGRFRQRFDLPELDINPDELYGTVRDKARGRGVRL